jgi:inhibitor of cysteine peptidase
MTRKFVTCGSLAIMLAGVWMARAADKKADPPKKPDPPKDARPEPPGQKPRPPDTKKPGSYVAGLWQYDLEILSSGTRRESRVGRLTYAGRQAGPAGLNDFHNTPWGPIYWVGNPKGPGDHGWLPRPAERVERKGKLLPLPGSGPSRTELNEADDGRTIKVLAGAKVFVRLRGNPTTGFRWQLAEKPGDTLEPLVDEEYAPDRGKPAAVGSGGSFTFAFRAVKPGSGVIRLAYRRPWEKDKKPAQTFSVTIAADPPPPQPAER